MLDRSFDCKQRRKVRRGGTRADDRVQGASDDQEVRTAERQASDVAADVGNRSHHAAGVDELLVARPKEDRALPAARGEGFLNLVSRSVGIVGSRKPDRSTLAYVGGAQ